MTQLRRLLGVALSLFATSLHAATRVALVSTCGGEAGADVLALAEATLSHQPEITLVERREVERVLQEQKLVRCGLSDSEQAAVVGRLLGAEVFVALETDPASKTTLGLIAYDARTGARLWDAVLPSDRVEATADGIVRAVRGACTKRSDPNPALRTVSVLAVRNADLPRELNSLCESVGLLLERQLVGSRSIIVLERQRLEQVNRERTLPTTTPADELFPSLVMVELEIGAAAGGHGLQAQAILSEANGTRLATIAATSATADPAELAQRLLEAVTKRLAVAAPGQGLNRVAEAERFGREAEFLMEHADRERALSTAEAAVALDPTNASHQNRLASHLVTLAHYLLQPDLEGGVNSNFHPLKVPTADLERSLKLVQRALRIREINIYDYLRRLVGVQAGHDDETQRLQAELQADCRRRLLATVAASTQAVHDAASFRLHTQRLVNPWLQYLRLYAAPSRTLVEDSAAWTEAWLALAANQPLTDDNFGSANALLAWPIAWLVYNHDPSLEDCAPWRALFDKMERHPLPIVQVYGQLGRLTWERRAGQLTAEAANQRAQAIVRHAQESLTGIWRYRTALDAIDAWPDATPADRWNAYRDLLRLMLARHEIAARVVAATTRAYVVRLDQHPAVFYGRVERLPGQSVPTILRNLDAVQTLLDAPDCQLLDVGRDTLAAQLARSRHDLIVEHPEFATPEPTPWTEARRLFVPFDHGLERIAHVCVAGDAAFLVGLGSKPGAPFVQAIRLSLPGGEVQKLGRALHPWPEVNNRHYIIPATCVANRQFYVGTREDGIFIFSTDNRPPQHLTTAEGLPSNWVHSLAWLDGRLYAGLGKDEGLLAVYDAATKRIDVLASSRRKEKRSPLDDASPFVVRDQRSDPARHRLLLNVAADTPRQGVWQLDIPTGALSRLAGTPAPCEWLGPIQRDRLLLAPVFPSRAVAFFDLQTNRVEPVCQVPPNQYAPFLWVNDWLWTGNNLGRVSRDGQRFEYFPALPDLDRRFVVTDVISLDAVSGGRQVLITKTSGVWLLTLPAPDVRAHRGNTATEDR